MPLYEYVCQDCDVKFDALRRMSAADSPIACPQCGVANAKRAISLFSAVGSNGVIAGDGGSCGTCKPSSACASCASRAH
jgi:putative FmdB family regulatory protein